MVINAGYYSVSEKERTGNIITIKANVMEKQPVGNPLAAVQEHMSGVNIIQNTGVPGDGFSFEVRGRNFINGVNDSLEIVDGGRDLNFIQKKPIFQGFREGWNWQASNRSPFNKF